jgi:hypothetical protein
MKQLAQRVEFLLSGDEGSLQLHLGERILMQRVVDANAGLRFPFQQSSELLPALLQLSSQHLYLLFYLDLLLSQHVHVTYIQPRLTT